MSFWVYLLRCSDGRYYTGQTEDLDVRLAQHRQGYFPNCWTYTRRPLELVWSEAMPTRDEALVAERMVGGWSRAKKEALIRGDWSLVSFFSCPLRERVTRFSTSLETNGFGDSERSPPASTEHLHPLVSSEVEKRDPTRAPTPLASNEVEKPVRPGRRE
ncbi:MAG TPA: GIY-YIG nuclease family protein [Allosphingosinicella sp.]|jgi:predicted GIY-YIG superfamily endonuclease